MASSKLKRKSDEFYSNSAKQDGPPEKRPKLSAVAGQSEAGSSVKCLREFYDVSCEQLARNLLGCVLVRVCEGGEGCRGRVVETEAYLGTDDKAAHSYKGHRTKRNEAMYMQPGTSYVYSIYGRYCCFNVSSRGDGAAVLIRALEPINGVTEMRQRRPAAKKDKDLCNGPSKLCQAMAIDKSCDGVDLVSGEGGVWVEEGAAGDDVIATTRIGVDYAEEWASKPLRFYLKNSKCVSKK